MGDPTDPPKPGEATKPETTAVVPKRRTFLPKLDHYSKPADGSPKLPVRVSCFEVVKEAGLEPWKFFSNFADEKFTFLGRSFTGGLHADLAKQLRADEKAFLAAAAKKAEDEDDDGDEDEPKADDDDKGGGDPSTPADGDDEHDKDGEHDKDDEDEHNDAEDDDDDDGKLKASDAFAVGTGLGLAGAPSHKRGIKVRGARKKPTSAKLSMHFFGLAIDIDFDFNFYPQTAGRTAINNILRRARLLFEPGKEAQAEPDIPWGWPLNANDKFKNLKHNQVVELNTKVKAYFALIDDKTTLEGLIKAATAEPWSGIEYEAAKALIDKDLRDAFGVIRNVKKKFGEKAQEKVFEIAKGTGLMTITKELHEGIGLSWGGSYGDLMHYDARNLAGDPKKIHKAIKSFKKDKTKQKELAKVWDEFKGKSEADMLEKFLEIYPKP